MSDVFISYSRIDACRNDPTSGRGEQDNVLDDTFTCGFKVKPNKDNSGLPGVNATLYACSVGECADKEHGVFSYYLLQGLRGQSNGQGTGNDHQFSQLHPTAGSGLGSDLSVKTRLAEPAGICQPSFNRNLFICCRQKPIMPTDWIGLYFCQRKHGQ